MKDSTSTAWSTTGKISSNEKLYDLTKIYDFLEVDFTEIYFKIKVYYQEKVDITDSNVTEISCEYSNIYTVIFRPESDCELNVSNGEITTCPLFSETIGSQSQLFVQTPKGTRFAVMVSPDSIISSSVRVNTDEGVQSIAANYGNFTDYPISDNDTFMYKSGVNSSNKSYYYYSKTGDSYYAYGRNSTGYSVYYLTNGTYRYTAQRDLYYYHGYYYYRYYTYSVSYFNYISFSYDAYYYATDFTNNIGYITKFLRTHYYYTNPTYYYYRWYSVVTGYYYYKYGPKYYYYSQKLENAYKTYYSYSIAEK